METHILAGIISSLIASILSLIFLIINFLRSTRTIIEQSEKKNFDHLLESISRHVYNSKDLLANHEDHLVSRKIQSEPLLESSCGRMLAESKKVSSSASWDCLCAPAGAMWPRDRREPR